MKDSIMPKTNGNKELHAALAQWLNENSALNDTDDEADSLLWSEVYEVYSTIEDLMDVG